MQKAISKYGLAAHLALLAVAPLFLYPLAGALWTGRALLSISLLAAVWMLMEPSRRKGEMLHDARSRVFASIVGDPLFWFSLLLAALAAIRMLNGGVSMAYNAELGQWTLSSSVVPFLPGGVDGAGFLPFCAVVAVAVLMQGCRHALGKSARICFAFVASFLAGLTSIVLCLATFCGHAASLAAAACSTADASFVGNAFGVYLGCGVVALVGAFERKWKRAMPLLIVGIGGCGAGLYVFAPDFVILACSASVILMLALSFLYAQKKIGGLIIPKSLALLLISAAAGLLVVLWVAPQYVRDTRFAWIFEEDGKMFSDGFMAARGALSSIAEATWKDNPWIGTGLGSFGMDIRFRAAPDMWQMLPPTQTGALNGWWQMLAERGISGVVFFVSPVVFLLWIYIMRAVAAVKDAVSRKNISSALVFHPLCWLGPVAVVVTAVCGFFDCSFWRPEEMTAVAAMFAMAGSAFPSVAGANGPEQDSEKETNG